MLVFAKWKLPSDLNLEVKLILLEILFASAKE